MTSPLISELCTLSVNADSSFCFAEPASKGLRIFNMDLMLDTPLLCSSHYTNGYNLLMGDFIVFPVRPILTLAPCTFSSPLANYSSTLAIYHRCRGVFLRTLTPIHPLEWFLLHVYALVVPPVEL